MSNQTIRPQTPEISLILFGLRNIQFSFMTFKLSISFLKRCIKVSEGIFRRGKTSSVMKVFPSTIMRSKVHPDDNSSDGPELKIEI